MPSTPRRRPVPTPSATVGDMETPKPRPPRDPLPAFWNTAWFWVTLWILFGLVAVSFWSRTLGLDGTVRLLEGITNLVKAARGN